MSTHQCFSRQTLQIVIVSSLMGLVGNIVISQPVKGESFLNGDLIAQQVVDGLPPPPPLPPADLGNYPPPSSPDETTVLPQATTATPDQLYMVFVNGSSPLLLEQVRQIQPDALIQEYQGQSVILVGAYETQELAQEQVLALTSQGISTAVAPVSREIFEPAQLGNEDFAGVPEVPPADDIVTIDSTSQPTIATSQPNTTQSTATTTQPTVIVTQPTITTTQPTVNQQPPPPREIEFAPVPQSAQAPPVTQPVAQSPTLAQTTVAAAPVLQDNAYYVVIPGSSENLPDVRDQVIMLGGRHDVVTQRERPLGPHVLVGPFVNRQAASRWNGFLRDFGMNARVYYRR